MACPVCGCNEGLKDLSGCRTLLNYTPFGLRLVMKDAAARYPFGLRLVMKDAAARYPEILEADNRFDLTKEEMIKYGFV